ncbi:uncharacterized protein LOC131613332 [Vicia villosa]|uniref:uncharacterized protein LOC131613332 n=1 Tax=Vicia villosa TaxID=3911 RepID=UPI00273BEC21|nr:uncharacterized protein LOC131613332 [Vicia villosa]
MVSTMIHPPYSTIENDFVMKIGEIVDTDNMTLEAEKSSGSGLFIPAKRGGSQSDATATEPSIAVVGMIGKDAKAGGKGNGKQAASGSDENASKGKGKGGKAADGLDSCTYVKGRKVFLFSSTIVTIYDHVLCEKQGKINEAYKKLQDGRLSNGYKVPPTEFAKVAQEYS